MNDGVRGESIHALRLTGGLPVAIPVRTVRKGSVASSFAMVKEINELLTGLRGTRAPSNAFKTKMTYPTARDRNVGPDI